MERGDRNRRSGGADATFDRRPLYYGAFVQIVYLLGLLSVPSLGTRPFGSLGLLAATGVIGGVTAGRLAGAPRRRRARYGAGSGAIGGVAFAVVYWSTMYVEWVPYGAYRYAANLVATRLPIPWYVAGYDPYVVGAAGLLALPAFVGLGYAAGWASPPPERELRIVRR